MAKDETPHSSKRKHEGDSQHAPGRNKKRRGNKKPKVLPGEDFDDILRLNLAIGRMNSQGLVEYMRSRTKQFEPKISDVELDDQSIPVNIVKDTSSWSSPRTRELLAGFLKDFSGDEDLAKASKEKGSPHTLVITGAGRRAANLTRALRVYQNKDAMVAKLFAKHIKMQDSIDICKRARLSIGVGTPQRIIDLIEDGALSTKLLKRITIDASHIDIKRKGILEMKDTLSPLTQLLNLEILKERYGSESPIEVFFF